MARTTKQTVAIIYEKVVQKSIKNKQYYALPFHRTSGSKYTSAIRHDTPLLQIHRKSQYLKDVLRYCLVSGL